jgi:HAD superfamily hydrolase (TIGR01484 family)
LKIIFFDLDGTLAPLGKPVPETVLQALRFLQHQDIRLSLCSGKPVYYLSGLARQLALEQLILIGENGLSVQVGADLPPHAHFTLPVPAICHPTLANIRRLALQQFDGRVWEQTNEVAVSFLFPEGTLNDEFRAFAERHEDFLTAGGVTAIEQKDAFDFQPSGIHKGLAIREVLKRLHLSPSEAAAVGDSYNDYPMFEACGTSVGISLPDPERADHAVADIEEALHLLAELAGVVLPPA